MHQFIEIITKPDNVAIVLFVLMVAFFACWAFKQAFANDRRRRSGKPVEGENDKKVSVWPNLARVELLGTLAITAVLLFWSVVINAPLEEAANPALTPSPAKAPWYFVGLQELLVYFDPWIAGVLLPGIIVLGLMAIPYLDINPKGSGYYTFSERKYAILIFCFCFFILWILLIVIGTFLRGPGWIWYWPWVEWDHNRVVYQANIDLTQLIGVDSRSTLGFLLGGFVLFMYYGLGMILPYLYWRSRNSDFLKMLGTIRYLVLLSLFLTMVALPIKILLRLLLNVKYVWVTPWFNI